ncbi:hypothetical protein ABR738_00070 [Streptomyces sp. Edi4]|uniref:hypothetical protein n=1 Tax=Streptomyces sp. Edi4 TaxID=3162527 RepID=UPI003305819E
MPIIGPGWTDPEYDDYDPAWRGQETPFRRWLLEKLTAAGNPCAADIACSYAPDNRYNGLGKGDCYDLAVMTGCTYEEVQAAHQKDLAVFKEEQRLLMEHPELVVLGADLDRLQRGNRL